ncbi:hypothetical protein FRC04_007741 [Tulasnella sp. 424]|nr:hypothetical protein FRC04_007741 [Tulasnella sp. 424]KAG8964310.1 hypothetical protein FRC05_003860 [Tulasnella sp. 425]
MSGYSPTDNSPSAPPPAFDFNLDETLKADFNPIVCSVSSQPRQPSLPPPEVTQERNPILSPSPSPPITPLEVRPSTFASPPKKTAALPTGPLQQSKLNFPTIDRKKWLELEKEKSRRSQEEKEAAKERARQHILWQQEERKKYERERKRDYRKRKVEEEISSGARFPNGKKRKTAPVRLQYPASSTLCNHSMPDATRPYREIRAHDHSKTKHTCGRKSKRTARSARRMRWLNRLVFGHIDTVARQVGYPFSPKEIVRRLKHQFPDLFATLQPQRISDWRDPNFPDRLVWRPFVTDALAKGDVPQKNPSRKYILDDYPDVISAIRKNLKAMRKTGIPLDLNTIRGLMIALITLDAPEVFERETAKGRLFLCSPSFVRRFIRQRLRWSFRRATKAAQTTPKDAPELTRRAFLRMACTVRDEDIPAALIVNADQTQVILAQGTKASYAETNSKQVDVVGQTEKRAFTLMLSVSQSGDALPFQAIYTGKDPQRSLPKPTAFAYNELVSLGHRFEVSKTSTYWATQETMRYYVIHIAAPYFRRKINELKLPGNQRCILYIDVWSVHRSAEFRGWLRTMYPWILLQFCPGGCTSLFQPCDANINRLAKEAIRRAALEDIIKETTAFLEAGISPESIVLDKTIGTLRNRTPGWLLAAWKAVNQGDHVLKVSLGALVERVAIIVFTDLHTLQSWELCATGDFNLSHQSLTSRSARQAILDLRSADPVFYAEITSGSPESVEAHAVYQEDEEMSETGDDGSSSSSDSEDDFFESEDEIWPKEAEDVDGDAIMVS